MSKYTLELDAKELNEIYISLQFRKDKLHEWLNSHNPANLSWNSVEARLRRVNQLINTIHKGMNPNDY